jgi:photosystem II stability/assembly factor-like uncharacterized protein
MQKTISSCCRLLIVCIVICSCTKHHDTPVTVPNPVVFDTLGAGWQRIKVDTTKNFQDIFFVDNQTGFLCGDKYIAKSTDGGLTWKQVLPDSLVGSYVNLYFLDANTGWAFGGGNFFLGTKNGGTSWQKIQMAGVFDGQFLDASNGYVTTGAGLFKTTDGGKTFIRANSFSGGGAAGLFFLDKNNGWFSNSQLNKTQDGGVSFLPAGPALPLAIYAIQFTDPLHGWLAGGGGGFRTTDGGATLITMTQNTSGGDIQFFDNNNGYVLSNGKSFSTTDGGVTLNLLCSIHKSILFEIHFTDPDHGWTAGLGGYVYRYVKP